MSSGVKVNDDCVSKFQELKMSHLHKFIVYKVTDDKKGVVVEKVGGPGAKFDEFIKALPEKDCRFGVFDFEWTKDGGSRKKLCFVQWSPENSPIKSKMIYSASKDGLRKALGSGIGVEVQATDPGEIAYETVLEKCESTFR
jgi:cofilin